MLMHFHIQVIYVRFFIDVAHMCELIQENVHEHVCKATFKWLNDTF